jgi:hypothetical protein
MASEASEAAAAEAGVETALEASEAAAAMQQFLAPPPPPASDHWERIKLRADALVHSRGPPEHLQEAEELYSA